MGTTITITESITVTVHYPFGVADNMVDTKRRAIADAIRSVTADHSIRKSITNAIFKACPLSRTISTAYTATDGPVRTDPESIVNANVIARTTRQPDAR